MSAPAQHRPVLSATFAINETVQRLRQQGRHICHLGIGEAPFPAHPRLVAALARSAAEKAYLPVSGLPELRQAVAAYYARKTPIDPGHCDVIVGPGSKVLLYALQLAIPGDLLLPVPSWVTYRPQAELLGQRVIDVETALSDAGLFLDPDRLKAAIARARQSGGNPTKLLLNYPNNPTGLYIPDDNMAAIAEVCRREGVRIIADEIYGFISFDGRYRSIAPYYPEGTIVTTGLSKHLSVGGWRLGVALVPKDIPGLFETLCNIASETWSCVASPVQFAAIEAYQSHADIEAYVHDMTAIHAAASRYVARGLNRMQLVCHEPQGGFYTWLQLGGATAAGLRKQFPTSLAMAQGLLEQVGVAVLPGTAFGEKATELKFRLACCDYDGAQALRVCSGKNAGDISDREIELFAPNMAEALNRIETFVQRG